jgi:hypothetical protein
MGTVLFSCIILRLRSERPRAGTLLTGCTASMSSGTVLIRCITSGRPATADGGCPGYVVFPAVHINRRKWLVQHASAQTPSAACRTAEWVPVITEILAWSGAIVRWFDNAMDEGVTNDESG